MNDYIEAVCVGKPMGLPEYNEDTEEWEVYFEESETPWNPYACLLYTSPSPRDRG